MLSLALRKYFEILGKNEENYNFSEDMLLYYNVKLFDEFNNNRTIFFLNQTVKLEIKFNQVNTINIMDINEFMFNSFKKIQKKLNFIFF